MTTQEVIHLSKQEAGDALRAAAWRVEDMEASDYGRTLIHCFLGGIGCDWDLDDAMRLVGRSTNRGWAWSLVDHELKIVADGKQYSFNAKAPTEAQP